MITTFTEQDQTETTEVEKRSYGSTRSGVLDNQLNIDTMPSYSGYASYDTSTNAVEEVPSFEVEKEYNIEGIKEDDIVVVPTFMPTIEPKYKPATKSNADVKIRLNARGKIIVSVFSVVAVLLMAFSIYNAVIIGRLNASLTSKQTELKKLEYQVDDAEIAYNSIISEDNILASLPNSYTEAGESVVIELGERPIINQAPEETNWFDKVCKFFSDLFN